MPLSCLKLITRPFLQASSLIFQPLRFIMDLKDLVTSLNDFASLSLAESWDNVGLLVEPSPPHIVNTLFLTNDLTEDVMQEALEKKANLILSYHPPIFHPLKRITWKTWKERLVIRALENRVGIYSPHTTYDAIPNGVNDWLATGLGACTSVPLKPATASTYPVGGPFRIEFSVASAERLETVLSQVHTIPEVSLITTQPARIEGEEQTRVSLNCSQLALLQVVALLSQKSLLYQTTEIISLEKPLLANTGMGRLCTLHEPASVSLLIEQLKSHLKLSHIRLALGAGKSLESSVKVVALCAGSGASILQDTESDLYVTGEMSHHEVLGAVSRGISVILCEHSNTERGFLLKLQQMLAVHFMNKINIIISERDRDPLQVV
ncbi:NIF3-like protein 1 [Ahaetulla prasina]|uniref:NIF3-like protein 1 n=1 Tax=Ahaetulla prasina TaxID=499056 RepID=UPI0026470B8B|nr:NIF3-like protein 1 [Ahaetulla prasina]XP_058043707.1 NIF3-like protein 1 [Ahaetulla prasina]